MSSEACVARARHKLLLPDLVYFPPSTSLALQRRVAQTAAVPSEPNGRKAKSVSNKDFPVNASTVEYLLHEAVSGRLGGWCGIGMLNCF